MDEYPNSSETWAPEAPEERKQAERKEEQLVSSSVGVLEDVIKWIRDHADAYQSVDALGVTEKTPVEDVKFALVLAKRMRTEFQSKEADLLARFAEHFNRIERNKEIRPE